RRMHFAPLQGETSKRLLAEPLRAQLDSVVYHPGDEPPLTRSSALIRFLTDCGGILSIPAQLLGLLPRRLLDGAYDCIARRRHRLAPARACPMEVSEKVGRILP
ncbi:MAG: DCC1-like thiol-disulfide oxidoreductase family protein, partial [Coraliomargarita sp.]